MTEGRPPPAGPGRSGRYRRERWAVVHALDAGARQQAALVQAACADHGIETTLMPVTDVARNLTNVDGLVLVLPQTAEGGVVTVLRRFVAVLARYRDARPHGTADVRAGRGDEWQAGPVQVVGPRAIVRATVMRQAMRNYAVCAEQLTGPGEDDLDVLAPHKGLRRPVIFPAGPEPGADVKESWNRLTAWGITDVTQVDQLLDAVEECRRLFDNPAFPALYRPVADIALNRLDFILDGVAHHPAQGRKAWMENGARCARRTVARLQEVLPGLARPAGNRKGLQADLCVLYASLRVVQQHRRSAPPSDRPPA